MCLSIQENGKIRAKIFGPLPNTWSVNTPQSIDEEKKEIQL